MQRQLSEKARVAPGRRQSLEGRARQTAMPSRDAIQIALGRIEGEAVELVAVGPVAEDRGASEGKHVGYGEPLLVRYLVRGEERKVVFRTMLPNWFGHDRRSDRAAMALLAADTYRTLDDHVRVLDVGALDEAGSLISLRQAGEFYLITGYAEGRLYAQDLRRIEKDGRSGEVDVARAEALAGYLAELHDQPHTRPHQVYVRAIRDLVGSGEGIFGLADSYPPGGRVTFDRLEAIEQRCVAWRWRLRRRTRRVRRTHGDFHPYNILFRQNVDFTLLDGSRGTEGESADDLAAMSINYFFGGVTHPEAWREGFAPLWGAFWSTYLATTADWEVLEVIAPFFAWRALVLASPVWYPDITDDARERILSFAEATLDAPAFDLSMAERFVR